MSEQKPQLEAELMVHTEACGNRAGLSHEHRQLPAAAPVNTFLPFVCFTVPETMTVLHGRGFNPSEPGAM